MAPDYFEDGKLAKISAEMPMIRQKGERAAHGLDAPQETKNDKAPCLDPNRFFADRLRRPAAGGQPA